MRETGRARAGRSTFTDRSRTPATNTTPRSAERSSSRFDRVYDSNRTRGAATPESGQRTPQTSGRARFDRYTGRSRGASTTRFVRIDSERSSPVVDLTDSAAPRRARTVVPRLRGTKTLSTRRVGSERFAPRNPRKSRASSTTPTRTTRVRTRPITRNSILDRYNGPKNSARTAGLASSRGSERLKGAASERTRGRTFRTPRKGKLAAKTPARQRGRSNRNFDVLSQASPSVASKIDRAAIASARISNVALRTSINASLAFGGSYGNVGIGFGWYNNDFANPGGYYYPGYVNNCNFWGTFGTWSFNNACNFWFPGRRFYYGSYCPLWFGYRSRFFGGFPYYYSSLYTNRYFDDVDDDDEYEEGFEEGYERGFDRGVAGGYVEPVQEGEGVIQSTGNAAPANVAGGQMIPSSTAIGNEALSRAAAHYLTVGDLAFQEGRFGDAVHFYAKAIEFAPDEGVLYLILSDALFATGDYHYSAYALRKALELDATLTESIDDKHSFYADPSEFDRQLATLELFLQDHYVDDDARLLLAANYLFGNRPAAAVDLLESSFSKTVRESSSGQILLTAAKSIQHGTPTSD